MPRVELGMAIVGRHSRATCARSLPALCLLLAALAAPAPALVHMAGDGSGNTTPPADDPGFANIGSMSNGLGGIYLGGGWVLTANHVGGPQSIRLNGIWYPGVDGSYVVIQHAPGVDADLAMYRITGSPPLPSPPIAFSPPVAGELVTMIGRGWVREPTETCWNASWAEISCSPPGLVAHRGFLRLYGALAGMRWGRNEVLESGVDVPLAGSTTRAFEVKFDDPGFTEEAQAVNGDSGGAVFVKRSGQWQLCGVLFTIAVFSGQPAATAVFGQSTYSVDLAHYRNKILAQTVPPVVPSLPWPALPLGAAVLAACVRGALSARRRGRTPARRG